MMRLAEDCQRLNYGVVYADLLNGAMSSPTSSGLASTCATRGAEREEESSGQAGDGAGGVWRDSSRGRITPSTGPARAAGFRQRARPTGLGRICWRSSLELADQLSVASGRRGATIEIVDNCVTLEMEEQTPSNSTKLMGARVGRDHDDSGDDSALYMG